EKDGSYTVARLGGVGQGDGTRDEGAWRDRCGGGAGAVGEDGSDGEHGAGRELDVGTVGGEEAEGASVGDGEVDGDGGGVVQEHAVKRAGHTEEPRARGGIGVPGAGGTAVQLQTGNGAAAARRQRHREGAVEGAVGAQSEIAC